MKRDMDLASKIIFEIEKNKDPFSSEKIAIDNYNGNYISYHIKLLYEASLIDAIDDSISGNFSWHAFNLTWQGHEFLDAARDEDRWNNAKKL